MHLTRGQRDPAAAFPLANTRDDAADRRQANRAVAVSAAGLTVTGVAELLIAFSPDRPGCLATPCTTCPTCRPARWCSWGSGVSRRVPAERYPHGYERAEDLVGVGIAVVIWASAVLTAAESIRKIISHGGTGHVGAGIVGAATGIIGNQGVARYKLTIGRGRRRDPGTGSFTWTARAA